MAAIMLPIAEPKHTWPYVWSLVRSFAKQLVLVISLQGISTFFALALPWLVGKLIDDLASDATADTIWRFVAFAVTAATLQALFLRYADFITRKFGEDVFARVREDFMDAAVHLPLSTVERAGTGDLLTRTTRDVNSIQWVIRFGIPSILTALVTGGMTLVACILTDWMLALAVVTGLPVVVLASRSFLKRALPAYLAVNERHSHLNSTVTEAIEQAPTVDSLGMSPHIRRRVDTNAESTWYGEFACVRLRVSLFFFLFLSLAIPLACTVVWGAHLVAAGRVTIGMVSATALYVLRLRGPVIEVTMWLDEIQLATASLARLVGVQLVPADRAVGQKTPQHRVMETHDVSYAYHEGNPVLREVNLRLDTGERLAIVGPSGAGKSTLARMLAGIHPPTSGSVTVGGVELTELPEAQLRREVALVTQEFHVFVGTMADNLRVARAEASDEEMIRALIEIGAYEWFAELEDGLETMVGSGHHELTPAQAQQVALARLILLNPHTVILDEATSLLDPRAARSLEASLSRVLEGRTVVAIAHRLHTAHDADRIAVMEDGRIIELGSHDDLVARGGEYAQLWESWQAGTHA